MINRCILVGRLTKDPVARKGQSGVTFTSFTIAIDRIARAGQEKQTDFINCVTFNKTAEFVEQYVKKGFLVGVDGRIQTRNYEDSTGKRVYVTEIVADAVQNYEPRNSAARSAQPSNTYTANTSYETNESRYSSSSSDDDFSPTLDISSDDLPF